MVKSGENLMEACVVRIGLLLLVLLLSLSLSLSLQLLFSLSVHTHRHPHKEKAHPIFFLTTHYSSPQKRNKTLQNQKTLRSRLKKEKKNFGFFFTLLDLKNFCSVFIIIIIFFFFFFFFFFFVVDDFLSLVFFVFVFFV